MRPRAALLRRIMVLTLFVVVVAMTTTCGDSPATETATSTPEPTTEATTSVPALALEPILWGRSEHAYEDFLPEQLQALYADLSQELGKPLLFRVGQYVDRDDESGDWFLKGETLTVSYQEGEASVDVLRTKADDLIQRVQVAFPGLDENDSVEIYARLPEGRTVADLNPELEESCGSHNSVRTGLKPSTYVAGSLDELYYALCDGDPALSAELQSSRHVFVEENWITGEALP